jgi:hypothetical protein
MHTESSNGCGGQEMRILLEAKELLRRGHDITIVCPHESGLSQRTMSGLSQRTMKEDIPTIQMRFHHIFDVSAMWNVMGLAKNRDIQAKGILRLLDDRRLGRRLGKNGRKLIEGRFSCGIK